MYHEYFFSSSIIDILQEDLQTQRISWKFEDVSEARYNCIWSCAKIASPEVDYTMRGAEIYLSFSGCECTGWLLKNVLDLFRKHPPKICFELWASFSAYCILFWEIRKLSELCRVDSQLYIQSQNCIPSWGNEVWWPKEDCRRKGRRKGSLQEWPPLSKHPDFLYTLHTDRKHLAEHCLSQEPSEIAPADDLQNSFEKTFLDPACGNSVLLYPFQILGDTTSVLAPAGNPLNLLMRCFCEGCSRVCTVWTRSHIASSQGTASGCSISDLEVTFTFVWWWSPTVFSYPEVLK